MIGGENMKKRLKLNKKSNKGITLIALVITIIVMLILVSVTITMAVNGGLFEYARKAGTQTNEAIDAEQQLASGKLKVGEMWYNSIDDFIKNTPSSEQDEFTFTINDTKYTAQKGMKWENWVNSSYNVDGFKIKDTLIITADQEKEVRYGEGNTICDLKGQLIEENRYLWFRNIWVYGMGIG